jgi:hypothetical protein
MADGSKPGTGEPEGGAPADGQQDGSGDQDQQGGTGTDPQQPDPAADAAKWKALARKHEAQAKANADAAARLAAIEESQKSEQQKLAERLAAAEERARTAELAALRAEVASAKGVPAALALRLTGATREDLEADADTLLQHLRPDPRPKTPPVGEVAGHGTATAAGPADQFAALVKSG